MQDQPEATTTAKVTREEYEQALRLKMTKGFQKALNDPETMTISKEFFGQVCGMLHIMTQLSSIVFEQIDQQNAVITLPEFDISVRDVLITSDVLLETVAEMDV